MTTSHETLNALLDDPLAAETLRNMMLATSLPDDDDPNMHYNDDDFDPCTNDTDDINASCALADAMHDDYQTLIADPLRRDELTELALSLSLCPMHLCDYAICFDDANDECAAIRLIHPSHDT